MATQVINSEISIREKLNGLGNHRLHYDKMPAGSVIQTKYMSTNDGNSFTSSSFVYIGVSLDFAPMYANSLLHIKLNSSFWMSSAAAYHYVKLTKTINGVESDVGQWNDTYTNNYAWAGMQNWEKFIPANTRETITFKWYTSQPQGGTVWFPNDRLDNQDDKLTFAIQEIKQ